MNASPGHDTNPLRCSPPELGPGGGEGAPGEATRGGARGWATHLQPREKARGRHVMTGVRCPRVDVATARAILRATWREPRATSRWTSGAALQCHLDLDVRGLLTADKWTGCWFPSSARWGCRFASKSAATFAPHDASIVRTNRPNQDRHRRQGASRAASRPARRPSAAASRLGARPDGPRRSDRPAPDTPPAAPHAERTPDR